MWLGVSHKNSGLAGGAAEMLKELPLPYKTEMAVIFFTTNKMKC